MITPDDLTHSGIRTRRTKHGTTWPTRRNTTWSIHIRLNGEERARWRSVYRDDTTGQHYIITKGQRVTLSPELTAILAPHVSATQ